MHSGTKSLSFSHKGSSLAPNCCYNSYATERGFTCSNSKPRKIGNSLGVVLPKEEISRLRTGEGERLCFWVEGPNSDYQLTSYNPNFEEDMSIAKDVVRRYRNTLRQLAK